MYPNEFLLVYVL